MAKALGRHRHTIDAWTQKPWFPKQTKKGFKKQEVHDAVEAYEAEPEPGEYEEGTKEEKTALECKRLKILIEKERELLDQAREQTRQMIEEGHKASGKLIEKSEVEAGMISFLAELRSVIESWAKTAKADYPQHHEVFTKAVKLYLERLNEGL